MIQLPKHILSIINADDIEALIKEYLDLFSKAVENMATQYNVELDEDDKITEDDINDVLEEMGLDTLAQDTKTQLTDAFKELSKSLEEAVDSLNESKEKVDFELKMSAGSSGDTASFGVVLSGKDEEESFKLSIDTEITENSKASVDVPDENVSDISEILPTIMYFIYSSNKLSDIDDIGGINEFEDETTVAVTQPESTLDNPGVAPLKLDDSTCNLSFDDSKASFDGENSDLDSGYIFLDDLNANYSYSCVSYIDDANSYLPKDKAEKSTTFTTKSGYEFNINSYASNTEIDAYTKLDNGKYLFFEGNSYDTIEDFEVFLNSVVQKIEVK